VLAASLAAGAGMPEAMRRAVTAGALAVEREGTVPSIPTHAQVHERLLSSTPSA
jgi:ribokinase